MPKLKREGRYRKSHRIWECRKFVFGIDNEPSRNSVKDIEAFVQAAGQVQLVSSGVAGPVAAHIPVRCDCL